MSSWAWYMLGAHLEPRWLGRWSATVEGQLGGKVQSQFGLHKESLSQKATARKKRNTLPLGKFLINNLLLLKENLDS